MQTVDQPAVIDETVENNRTTNSVKVLVMGVEEAADVLQKFHAQRILPVDWSLVAGDIEGSHYLTVNYDLYPKK